MASKNKVNIDWGNGLWLVRHQITKTDVDLLAVGPLDKIFNEILIKLQLVWADDPKVQEKIIIDYIRRDFF